MREKPEQFGNTISKGSDVRSAYAIPMSSPDRSAESFDGVCPERSRGAQAERRSRRSLTAAEIEAVNQVLRTPYLSTAPRIADFEERFAAYIGTRRAVAVSSGTAGLHLCVIAALHGERCPFDKLRTSPEPASSRACAVLRPPLSLTKGLSKGRGIEGLRELVPEYELADS